MQSPLSDHAGPCLLPAQGSYTAGLLALVSPRGCRLAETLTCSVLPLHCSAYHRDCNRLQIVLRRYLRAAWSVRCTFCPILALRAHCVYCKRCSRRSCSVTSARTSPHTPKKLAFKTTKSTQSTKVWRAIYMQITPRRWVASRCKENRARENVEVCQQGLCLGMRLEGKGDHI